MALNAGKIKGNTSKKQKQPPLDAGGYPGRVVQVIDLGIQKQRPYQGQEKDPCQMVRVVYELVDEFCIDENGKTEEERPRWVSEEFPLKGLYAELAKSTKRYLAIDPEKKFEGDWTKLTSMPVMVTITKEPSKREEGVFFNNVASLSVIRKKEADKMPELKNDELVFDQSDLSTVDAFFTLPEWVQDKIKEGLKWEGSPMAKAVSNYKKEEKDEEPKKPSKEKEEAQEDDEPDVSASADNEDEW